MVPKSVLRAFAILALMAGSRAEITEYSKAAFDSLQLVDPNLEKISASVINADIPRTFSAWDTSDKTVGSFSNTPTGAGNHPYCKSDLGIQLTEDHEFCKMDVIGVGYGPENSGSTKSLIISLRFGMGSEEPMVLQVPVFKIPSQHAENLDTLKTWVAKEQVGYISPFDLKDLENIKQAIENTKDFKWLENLLTYGITQASRPASVPERARFVDAETYVTNPLVLPEDIVNKWEEILLEFTTWP